ncbi:SDR family oxidoreductase [Planctomicrobium sp. SH664]|uniref:SDR family oxidoreductase n=1 Tax=Planctomicrobium sp. SH664 TaxID=3448125 RepID=UPI003F5C2DD0
MSLAGKSVLVTGGGSGIGAACALALAGAGCRVAIAGRREEVLKATAAQFAGQPGILTKGVDVANRAQVKELVAWAEEQFGQIDILINSAGTNVPKRRLDNLDPDDWDRLMDINATGTFNCIIAALPKMRERQDGQIFNISSVSGLRANPLGGVMYNASKFAATGLGMSIASEERVNGIRVTNVYPGEVDTPILVNRPSPVTDEHRARILKPDDVAEMVLAIAQLPPRAHVSEIVIKPTWQDYF